MALCYDPNNKIYVYCASHLSAYVAAGVIIPLAILLVIALMYIYFRCKRRRLRRQEQQTYMPTIIPMYHNNERYEAPYNYSYPSHYPSMPEDGFDKPPSYEQTIQQISEINNNNNRVEDSPAILPVSSERPIELTRH